MPGRRGAGCLQPPAADSHTARRHATPPIQDTCGQWSAPGGFWRAATFMSELRVALWGRPGASCAPWVAICTAIDVGGARPSPFYSQETRGPGDGRCGSNGEDTCACWTESQSHLRNDGLKASVCGGIQPIRTDRCAHCPRSGPASRMYRDGCRRPSGGGGGG